jgi:hypothetical protein
MLIGLVAAVLVCAATERARGAQLDIHGPAGSAAFGESITTLSNGNFVVADPGFGADDVGAVHL